MKALVGTFNQEKALVGAFSVIVKLVLEPMDRFTALVVVLQVSALTFSLLTTISCSGLRQESLIDIDGPEEDEDMIYECPGLAPHGEMEVTNPFFLQREFNLHTDTETEAEVDAEVSEAATPAQAATSAPPCPVNTSTTISHGTIARTQH